MTEDQWLSCTDPTPMLEFLRGKVSDRKLRLFSVACVRRLTGLFPNAALRDVVEFGERDADGLASKQEMLRVQDSVARGGGSASTWGAGSVNTQGEASAVRAAAELAMSRPLPRADLARRTARYAAASIPDAANNREAIQSAPAGEEVRVARAVWQAARAAWAAELAAQADLLREVIGNPFCPLALDRAWLSPEVVYLARRVYEERAFEWAAELADTLAEAGCKAPDLLAHLRGPGPHVLGCWALDLVVGKE